MVNRLRRSSYSTVTDVSNTMFDLFTSNSQIILDGNFIFAALKVKLDIQERLDKLLQGETIKIYVLKSVLAELAAAGSKTASALEFAKSFCDVIDDSMFEGDTPCEKLKALLGKFTKN